MKRRDFLRRFGIGAAAAVAAPAVVKSVVESSALPEPTHIAVKSDPPGDIARGVWEQMKEENMHPHYAQYPMTTDECYTSEFDDAQRIEWEKKHWAELVKRYGKGMSIFDLIHTNGLP